MKEILYADWWLTDVNVNKLYYIIVIYYALHKWYKTRVIVFIVLFDSS